MIPKRSLHVSLRGGRRHYHYLLLSSTNNRRNQLLLIQQQQQQHRSIVSLVGVLRSVLKIRYIILGSAVGGGLHANNKYQQWKENLPDFSWIKDLIPDETKQNNFKDTLSDLKQKLITENRFFDRLAENTEATIRQFREMLREKQQRQQELLFLSSESDSSSSKSSIFNNGNSWYDPDDDGHDNNGDSTTILPPPSIDTNTHHIKNPFAKDSSSPASSSEKERIDKLHNELIRIQNKYQKEIERLENENKRLKQSLLLKTDKSHVSEKLKKANKTLIDLYSDVLDELNEFDSNYQTQDHLPRVIVVGDQSAGKTSVLEMIAHARIFPRGAGEMMTRSPVKVTLKEGPYHIAKFKDQDREFDLIRESELADLRSAIERRMKARVKPGQTVSKDVISLTVEGPGLPRMVLIDLPGVISTVTTEMATDTRQAIEEITKYYMGNPNAIILCVQDGSVDAERSIVTDLVSQMDPQGRRTIFVMTKIDLAEQNMSNPTRLKKILEGKLFPMKALGYFAVVTGRGGKDDSINSIKEYEEDFFKNSRLCKQGILNTSQCTTQNLSFAVSDCFWKMVKAAVEQQADLYKARKFNLETEWKNTFSKYRELDRDELFEIGKNQILDQIIKLSHYNELHWETLFFQRLNENFKRFIFEEIYLPCAEKADVENFNVLIDIKLKNWIDNWLPAKTVETGWQVLREQFQKTLIPNVDQRKSCDQTQNNESDDQLFQRLKMAVSETVLEHHQWDGKAADVIKLLQMNSSEDRIVSSKEKWKESAKYWQDLINDRIVSTENRLNELFGPNWIQRWLSWSYRTDDQLINVNIRNELDVLISNNQNQNTLKPVLDAEDLLLVKKRLRANKIDVTDDDIQTIWNELYKYNFLNKLMSKAENCEKLYAHHMYKLDSDISCDDVVFFYRVRHILQASSKALRQQTTNIEIQRLNRELKEILDDFNQDYRQKSTLLVGKRVALAEELKRVRRIQEKLEEFIAALNQEK